MNKFLFYALFGLIMAACGKKDTVCNYNDSSTVAPATEVQALQSYLSSNNINATANPSGFYYQITTKGSGASIVNLCSTVSVTYVGKMTNGTVFDQTSPGEVRSFQLGQVIVGWQKGLPLINKGGTIRLYIPPSLAYGNMQQGPIPPNSILIFEITVVDIS